MTKLVRFFGMMILSLLVMGGFSQSASVSPSRLYFKVAPGGYKSQKVRVTNNGKNKSTFRVDFADFNASGNKGKSTIMEKGKNARGCSQWMSASPSFFDLAPGETQDVEILLQVPNTPEANTARWAVASIKLTQENKGPADKGSDVVGMQIIQSFQFIVHIFQTPPAVTFKEASILKFYQDSTNTDSLIKLRMEVRNTGDAIINCVPYVDILNVSTGEKIKVKNKAFTLLPEAEREIVFVLPKKLAKGSYDVLGVVDYDSDTDIAGAELKLEIK